MLPFRAYLFVVSWILLDETFAYDYTSSCARPFRSSRTKRANAPCDLSKQSYCTTPGSSYPWHAVRRFVHENQGLMRRMYGEQRHISVLKSEIENEIDENDDYMHYEVKKADAFAEEIIKTKILYTKKGHGRSLNVKPYFRPIQSTTAKPSNKSNVTTTESIIAQDEVTTQQPQNETDISNTTEKDNRTEIISNETINEDKNVSYKTSILYKDGTKLESIANVEINHLDPDVITLEAVIKQSIESNSVYPNYPVSAKNDIEERNPTTPTLVPATENTTEFGSEEVTTFTEYEADVKTTTEATKEGWKPINIDTSTLPPTLLFSDHNKVKNLDQKLEANSSEKVKEEFHPKPQKDESARPAVLKLRGVNACVVNEEVVAPFWANSTRGEQLVLLNMYPFEQYVHLETCVHDRKHYCREGCRCEQQYRLHKLLAYDPNNECRGIFADWFRFPSCCACKCYDVPIEYRATSRSPRVLAPQYDEEVRKAIYEDVAKDWYTITTFDDDDDDDHEF